MILDIDADYAIAQAGKWNQLAADIADDEQAFELAAHAAAEVAANRMSLAEKTREDRYADASEIRAEATSLEDEDLANDLATEEETRQNAYATADAGWLAEEAAAEIASTAIAALGTKNLINDLVTAEVAYITAANPLLTTATQAFNNLIDVAYVAAYGGDVDQTAVSGAWTMYFNTLATEAQTATTTATTAYQIYMNALATDIETMFNDIASEATARATDIGLALTNYISTVTAAATLETSQSAAAGVAWVDTVATDEKNAVKNMATAWQQQADDDAASATVQADDYSTHWNTFTHSYLTALTPHQTNLINEDRVAQQSANTELTTLAQGAANEHFNLINDDLTEQKTAALALSPLDDLITNAWAVLESASSITYAWMTHAYTQAAPLSDFESTWPGGAVPMSSSYLSIGDELDNILDEQLQRQTVQSTLDTAGWNYTGEPAANVLPSSGTVLIVDQLGDAGLIRSTVTSFGATNFIASVSSLLSYHGYDVNLSSGVGAEMVLTQALPDRIAGIIILGHGAPDNVGFAMGTDFHQQLASANAELDMVVFLGCFGTEFCDNYLPATYLSNSAFTRTKSGFSWPWQLQYGTVLSDLSEWLDNGDASSSHGIIPRELFANVTGSVFFVSHVSKWSGGSGIWQIPMGY